MNEPTFNFKDIIEETQDIIIVTRASPLDEPGPEIVYVNKAFTRLTGYTAEEAIGNNPRMLQTEATDKASRDKVRQALERGEATRVTLKNTGKTGDEYWLDMSILPLRNEAGEITHFAAIERDVSDQKRLEQELDRLAKKDPLTGFLNRRAFDEIIDHEFSRFLRNFKGFSILFIDIDHFKSINDRNGHAIGDEVLENFANVFELIFRPYDSIARFGGDEFCILLTETALEKAINSAERLRQVVEKSIFSITDESVKVTISIGVSEVKYSDTHYDEVIQRADRALYLAKENGRNQVQSQPAETIDD